MRAAVARRRDELFELAAELVRRASTARLRRARAEPRRRRGSREPASRSSGSSPTPRPRSPIRTPATPSLSYEGRSSVVGTRLAAPGGGRSLHLSGHVDVVPVERAGGVDARPVGRRDRGRPAVGPRRRRHEGRARRLPRRRGRGRRGLRRQPRRPRRQLGDRGGVRRQRHVVGACAPATAPTRR